MNKQSFNSETFSAGGVTVTTANPIILNTTPESPKDYYLNADSNPTQAQADSAKKKGLTWDKVKGTWVKAEQSGLIDSLLGFFGAKQPQDTIPTTQDNVPAAAPTDKPMSQTTKIVIGVGVAVAAGVIIYAIVKNNKKGK